MKKHTIAAAAACMLLAACATAPTPAELDQRTVEVMKASFREQGIAKMDRIAQDLGQSACSSDKPPAEAVAKQIEAQALASIKPPSDGRYLGDWKAGEAIAQNGRGLTWTDAANAPNGGNCYNCHQIAKAEISHGTIGPSLHNYGKLRGVKDPASAEAAPIVQYTWGKIFNSKATNACSGMPRFGHAGILTEAQMRDVMALLLDPKSPVNE
ncbi:MAG TPA: sulfur oxidation c-type cytochrome SoxX [Burkholderiaceae bacterium]|nr:sulfur oxidation c-type cytochrome SoxX [Burkholderiaceae bacterium]